MKIRLLLFVLFMVTISVKAQTNTFPSSGNVGIGTLSPQSLLQLIESSDSRPAGLIAPSKSILKLSRAGTTNYSYPESAEFKLTHGGPSVWGSRLDLYINGATNQTDVPDQHAMTWLYNGNVGIGTSTPRAMLDVGSYASNKLSTVLGRLQEGDYSNEGTFLGVRGYNTIPADSKSFALEHSFYGQVNSSIGFFRGQSITGGYINFSTFDNEERMRISSNGNVGIGTINPTEKLSVNGNIRAKEIKVETANWPDYVFEADYKITPLAELEKFIQVNKHLPEMPSAKVAESKGVEVGNMIKLQQQKIEELTLYIITQQKYIESQDKRLKKIEDKLKK